MAGLDFTTYAGTMKGGASGAVIKAGDPANSLIVQKVQDGKHPGHFSPAEMEALKTWITSGATEAGDGAVVTAPDATAGGEAWTGGIDQLIAAKCATCHVTTALGELSLKTYADALKGGKSGPAIVPNDPAKSVLVQIQEKGGHPGQFTPAELQRIITWINAGAPETSGTSGAAPAATPAPAAPVAAIKTWTDATALFSTKCVLCHIEAQAGGYSLKTYPDALKGGTSGPAIVPGDPDKSVLVSVQRGTTHPAMGKLMPEELAAVIAWIEAGAPEK